MSDHAQCEDMFDDVYGMIGDYMVCTVAPGSVTAGR
jgi:hypothetical protein